MDQETLKVTLWQLTQAASIHLRGTRGANLFDDEIPTDAEGKITVACVAAISRSLVGLIETERGHRAREQYRKMLRFLNNYNPEPVREKLALQI